VTAPEEIAAVQMVPAAVEAYLDDVAGELVERRRQLVELGGVRDAAPIGPLEGVSVHVGDEPDAVARAYGAVVRSALADVATGAEELGVGVADVAAADRPAPEIPQDCTARQCVVDVRRHGRSVRARRRRACPCVGGDAGRSAAVRALRQAAPPTARRHRTVVNTRRPADDRVGA